MERQELLNYHVVFTRDPETAAVVAELPTLQLAEFGADLPEALERLQAMANFHLDCLVQEGKPIPVEDTKEAGLYLHVTRSPMPLRPLRAREIVRRLQSIGFVFRRQSGSHARYVHADGRGVTVPMHSGDVPVPVIRAILRQAGLSEAQWEAL